MSSTASWFERVRDTYSNWFARESDTGTIDGDGYLPAILVEATTDAYLTADFYYEIDAGSDPWIVTVSTDAYLSAENSLEVYAITSVGTTLGISASVTDTSVEIAYDITVSTALAITASTVFGFVFFPGSLIKSVNTVLSLSADFSQSIRTDLNKRGSLVWNRKKKRYVAVAVSAQP